MSVVDDLPAEFVVGVLDMNLAIDGLAHHRSIVAGPGGCNWLKV